MSLQRDPKQRCRQGERLRLFWESSKPFLRCQWYQSNRQLWLSPWCERCRKNHFIGNDFRRNGCLCRLCLTIPPIEGCHHHSRCLGINFLGGWNGTIMCVV